MSIQLLLFDTNHNLHYGGYCTLQINQISSMLNVKPVIEEEYKPTYALFKWDFAKYKNALFIFAEHNFMDFALFFDDESVCENFYNIISQIKGATSNIEHQMVQNRFFDPICQKIVQNDPTSLAVKNIVLNWLDEFEDNQREIYSNLLQEICLKISQEAHEFHGSALPYAERQLIKFSEKHEKNRLIMADLRRQIELLEKELKKEKQKNVENEIKIEELNNNVTDLQKQIDEIRAVENFATPNNENVIDILHGIDEEEEESAETLENALSAATNENERFIILWKLGRKYHKEAKKFGEIGPSRIKLLKKEAMVTQKGLLLGYRGKKRKLGEESDTEDDEHSDEQDELIDYDIFSNDIDEFGEPDAPNLGPTANDNVFCYDLFSDDDDEEDDETNFLTQHSEPLYSGSTKTKQDFAIDFLELIRSENLTDSAAKSILKFTQKYFPPDNKIFKSLKSVHKCLKLASPDGLICTKTAVCQACGEKSCNCKDSNIAYFAGFNVENQVSLIVKENGKSMVKHRKRCADAKNFIDIMSGEEYEKRLKILPLNSIPITFLLYIDGGKYAKSGKYEAWPLLATIAELPPKLRQSGRNHIFIGIMYCNGKPNWRVMCDFFKSKCPLGTVISIDGLNYHLWCSGLICDLPARSSFINITGPNGYNACCQCTVKGAYYERRVIYPPGLYRSRTNKEIEELQKLADKENEGKRIKKAHEGVRGSNELENILKIPDAVTADLMHTGYCGPVLQTIEKLYNGFKGDIVVKAFTKEEKEFINTTISSIEWPCEIKRKLRPLTDLSLFKASELRLLLHFVIPTVVSSIMAESRVEESSNLMHLVAGIISLSKDQISAEDIEHAANLLHEWHTKLGNYFDETSYTFKAHDILHFPQQVKNHGPLPGHSAFAGENMIGFIGRQVTCYGKEVALSQICQRLDTVFRLRQINRYIKSPSKKEFKEDAKNLLARLRINLPNSKFYEFKTFKNTLLRSAMSDDPEPNSIILFMDENQMKCGIIKAWIESNNVFYVAVKAVIVKDLYKVYSTDFSLLASGKSFPEYAYFENEQKFSDQHFIIEEKAILHKAILIRTPNVTFVVPLLSAFDHN